MFKTVKGIILRRQKFGEAHAYLTVLTPEGLITFAAYGIMSPKSKNFAACNPYTLSEFVLTSKGDRFTLSQASTVTHVIRQGIDFEWLSLANYISSMACETAFAVEDAPAIFSLTCNALALTDCKQGNKIPPETVKAVFELRLTAALGFYPELNECSCCGKAHDGGIFVPRDGSVICGKCNLSEVSGIAVTKELTSAIEHMLSLSDRQAFGIRFNDETAFRTFCEIAESFSTEHLECAKAALNYYKQNLKNF